MKCISTLKKHKKAVTLTFLGAFGIAKLQKEESVPFSRLQKMLYLPGISKLALPIASSNFTANLASYILTNKTVSKPLIKSFVRKYKINMQDFSPSNENEYKDFNHFFKRELKEGARKVDANPQSIVSPTDSHLLVIENIEESQEFCIKNSPFQLSSFLNSYQLSQEFKGGTLAIFRLSPEQYHHYHFPVDCSPSSATTIHGTLGAVNNIAYQHNKSPLVDNRRKLITLQPSKPHKAILMVTIGAMCIGRMQETFTPHIKQKKGGKCGFFEFGGSTVAVVFPKDAIVIEPAIGEKSQKNQETLIKMGEPFAKWKQN